MTEAKSVPQASTLQRRNRKVGLTMIGIAAAMVFFYFTAILILFGAELNRALRQHFAARSVSPYLGDDG